MAVTISESLPGAPHSAINPAALRRTSLAFFCNFLVGGLMGPFLSPVLMARGFNHSQIGLTYSAIYLGGTIMPLLVGHVADSYVSLGRAIRSACGSILLCSTLLWFVAGGQYEVHHVSLFVVFLLMLTVSRAPLGSLLDTLAMQVAHNQAPQYARIRLCGSLAFVASATSAGYLLSDGHLHRFFSALVALAALACATGWLLPDERRSPERLRTDLRRASHAEFRRQLDRPFWLWMAAMMLHWLAFVPYQYGFSMYLQEQHVLPSATGVLWSIGVVAEMVTFASCGWFFRRLSVHTVLGLTFAAGLLRWTMLGALPSLPVIALSQLLHGPSFALFYSACMQALNLFGGGRFRSSFQGLFAALVSGFSASVGTALAGVLHGHMPFHVVMLWAIPIEIAAAFLLWRGRHSFAAKGLMQVAAGH